MSKKNKPQPEPAQPQTQPAVSEPPARPAKDVSKAQLWTFWIAVALAVIVARALNHALPGVSESVIERWVILGFGVFMAAFLIKLK